MVLDVYFNSNVGRTALDFKNTDNRSGSDLETIATRFLQYLRQALKMSKNELYRLIYNLVPPNNGRHSPLDSNHLQKRHPSVKI